MKEVLHINKAQPLKEYTETYERFLCCLHPAARLAWDTAMATGLRVSDIITLRKEQIKNHALICEKKTGKKRIVQFPFTLQKRLIANADKYKSPYCFPGNSAGHIHRDTLGKMIVKAKHDAGINGTVSMHSARKMYAKRIYDECGDVDVVQNALGHDHLATTLLYLFGAKTIG